MLLFICLYKAIVTKKEKVTLNLNIKYNSHNGKYSRCNLTNCMISLILYVITNHTNIWSIMNILYKSDNPIDFVHIYNFQSDYTQ